MMVELQGTLLRPVLFVVCLWIISVDSSDSLCPPAYYSNNNQCYLYVSTELSWSDARSNCRRMYSGDLLIIRSDSVRLAVWRHTGRTDEEEVWVGAYKNKWLDGTKMKSSYWLEDEPSGGGEDCVEVWKDGDETGLNDEDCHWERESACEAKECFSISNCISGTTCPWNSRYFGRNVCGRCADGYYSGGLGKGCKKCFSIPNCISGTTCPGKSTSFRKNECDTCADGYYSGGLGKGCIGCTKKIPNCVQEKCYSSTDQTCIRCVNNNVFYKLTNNARTCARMCSSDGHYCWPGICTNALASYCTCAKGFRKESTASELFCQPTTKPEVHECHTTFIGPNVEKKRVMSNTASTQCQYLQDTYGHFQPTRIIFKMASEFTIYITSLLRPRYISEERFGITDTTIILKKLSTSDSLHTISTYQQKTDTSSGYNAERYVVNNGKLYVHGSKYTLNNGEALCVQYKAEGGGYFKTIPFYSSNTRQKEPYDKTVTTETKCYKFDNAPPKHCLERNPCRTEPLHLDTRVTRSGIVKASFGGWSDPIPNQNFPSQASGIEHFEVRVSETIPAGDKLKVDLSIYFEEKLPGTEVDNLNLNLTVSSPKLFCVLLEVKDVADNIRQARRFVLSDSTSYLEVWEDKPFYVNSSSFETSYVWQTHLNDICLTWKERFYNNYYLHNPLLNAIEADPNGFITGIYEQVSGVLPVKGTPNVHGIIKYLASWSLNGGPFTKPVEVENFLHQYFCQDLPLEDGQTYTFVITAVDIVNNVLSENRTVHIDHSAPHINEIGLIKDGFKGLIVHDERDLSEMNMYFEALDPHSGIRNVEWWFGIEDTQEELDRGVLGATRISGNCDEDAAVQACYCPDIGLCENNGYNIPLHKLVVNHVHLGDHHREYFFKIKATNMAHLSTTEYATILVDYSPPEVGVIHEGSVDGKDIDYTSEDTVMVHWYGFIDHESGINMYRIGIANRCLHRDELYDYKNVTEIEVFSEVGYTENSVRLNISFTGKMYVSVIAFNNAMDSSNSVCSDGITRDVRPPHFNNLTIAQALISSATFCLDEHPWILNSDLSVSQLQLYTDCKDRCSETELMPPYVTAFPQSQDFINSASEIDLCRTLPKLTNRTIIYLPKDNIHLTWDIDESESQIDDFYVGIGIEASEAESPQMVAYSSTNRKAYFKHRHEGISPDEMFYLFLKAVSRSGLEKIITIGPMLIDSTPPLYKKKPDVNINEGNIIISWDEDTFYDLEQTEQINRIEYTFGNPGNDFQRHCVRRSSALLEGINAKSNRLEWDLMTQQSCGNITCCCIKYPLANLKDKDTDLGLEFYVRLYVYNNAGHFLEVDTDLFQIPSRYPPGQAIVYDVDPENTMQFDSDIDVHFTVGTLCASWEGFEHHENVSIEVGVGSDDTKADIVPFQTSNGSNPHCVSATSIQADDIYFFLVKASSSAGETVSVSNGISVFDVACLTSKLTVYAGSDCAKNLNIEEKTIKIGPGLSHRLQFDTKIDIGGIFFILIETGTTPSPNITLTSDNILAIPESAYPERIYFATYIERPNFILSAHDETSVRRINVTMFRCPSAKSIPAGIGFTTHWISSIDPSVFNFRFEAGIVEKGTGNSPISEFDTTYGMTHMFRNITLHSFTDYQFAIKPCTNQICLDAVFSDVFRVEMVRPTGMIDHAELRSSHDKSCFDFAMAWKSFQTDSAVLFYQWTLSKNELASNNVMPWTSVKSSDVNQITQCIEIQPHAYTNMFGCVKAFSLAGSHTMICKTISMIRTGTYMYNRHVVYDLDHKADSWNTILNVVHSADLGSGYTFLHDNELDIAPVDSGIAGAILGTYGRNITWYLMTSPVIPREHCENNEGCYFYTESEDGCVIIPDDVIDRNTLYFICAYSNTTVQLEHTLDEFFSCSNGFIKDDEPPSATSDTVYVTNNNGFITDTSRMVIRWDEFTDNINASQLGYPQSIRSYSYGIGNDRGKDDIMRFTNTGHSTVVVSRDLNIKDGLHVFVTVKAFDYVGLESTIHSGELLVDTSPPETGTILLEPEMVEIDISYYIRTNNIVLHLYDFEDKESGISHFELGVGNFMFLNDILPLARYYMNVVQLHLEEKLFMDGRTYYINVKAVNNAGLGTGFVSGKLNIDTSPPTGGHVIDGHLMQEADEDFSSEIYRVEAHWKGFIDPHSNIHFYKCGFGTKPYSDNIRHFVNVGLKQAIEWTGPFISGQAYYTTVKACNHAGLCRTLSSNGIILDNSPPIQGLVKIGSEDFHQKYYPHTNWLYIHWVGFEDPQSGIDHYDVCVGTSIGVCDSVRKFGSLLVTNVIKTELDLPVNTDLYATVTAYNKVGMNVSHTSDSFRIDDTSPVLKEKPRFLDPSSLEEENAVQWEKSIVKVNWLFADQDSPIIRNELTFLTHHEGHTPKEHISLGAENNFTINLGHRDWLHNGDIYYVKVTACNAARRCSTSQSNDLRIDSTPPHVGGFRKPLKWTNYNDAQSKTKTNLTITWYGFHDQESRISHYYITVSRTYSGQELTDGVFTFIAENIANEYKADIPLVEKITQDELLILTIWAKNGAGLTSSAARSSVYVLSKTTEEDESLKHGELEIEKHSCDIHFCNKDCTCAIMGQHCVHFESNSTCTEIVSSGFPEYGFPVVDVRFGYKFEDRQIRTPSSACLSGTWKLLNSSRMAVARYEWSMGLSGQPIGDGIFDLKTEQPWTDVGIRKKIIHCLPVNRSLLHRESYVLYVRAWYTHDTYATFQSSAITIDQSAPSVRRGRFIKDSDASCNVDFDFIDWTENITGCWSGVFREELGLITHYTVAFGTLPHADDVFQKTNVGLDTKITLSNVSLTHATRYFFTVTAYNTAGLSTTLSSDGFHVDTDIPLEGIVFNSLRWQNREFQSSDSSMNISWSGFTDHFSGIYKYHVAVSESNNKTSAETLTFLPVILKTFHTFANMSLQQNKTYYAAVKAWDSIGHFSSVAFSPGITIDTSKPVGYKCRSYNDIENGTLLVNRSGKSKVEINLNITNDDLLRVIVTVKTDYLTKVYIDTGIETTYLYPLRIHNRTLQFGHTFFAEESTQSKVTLIALSDKESQTNYIVSKCLNLEINDQNAIYLAQTGLSTLGVDMLISDRESDLCSLELGAGTTDGGFQVQSLKKYDHQSNHAIIQTNVAHGSPIYVTVIAENCAGLQSVFKVGPINMDHTPPTIDDIHTSVKVSSVVVNGTLKKYVTIEGSWQVDDNESGVKYCFCGLETLLGAQDISSFWEADTRTSCFSPQLELEEDIQVRLVVKCINNAELYNIYTTDPHIVTHEPPNTENGLVYFLPSDNDNVHITAETDMYVQTSKSAVKIGWSDFESLTKIISYEYRLSSGESSVVNWQTTAAHDVVVIDGLNLNAGNSYTAEVKATDINGLTSDTISANLTVLEEKPRVSGKAVSVTRQDDQISLDWSQVFTTFHGIPITYTLAVGTKTGYSDVIDLRTIAASTKTIRIPSSTLLTPNPTELYIRISCSYPFGLDQVYEKTFKI